MTRQKEIAILLTMLATFSGFSAGFALYEGSARGNALGGAVMGKAVDASANFYNPATLTDLTGTVVTVGMTTEHPMADTSVNGRYTGKLDPGCFILPHLYVAQELPYDFSLGLGFAPEFGLGSSYRGDWPLVWDTRKTTIEGFVFNPNLAYKITEDWSVSAGFRLIYFTFDQYSKPMATRDHQKYGTLDNHLEGDNDMLDWGWQISSKYDITDKLSAGVMYKSYIDTRVRGHNSAKVRSYDDRAVAAQVDKGVRAALSQAGLMPGSAIYDQYYAAAYKQAYSAAVRQAHASVDEGARTANGDAGADLRLPQSVTIGFNYDATDKLHLGLAAAWTQWSSIDTLHFSLPADHDKDVHLGWQDVWRAGFGGAYDITDDLTFMMSYIYDLDPSSDKHGTTMLPPGDRHIGTVGLGYALGPFDISVSYGIVFMFGESRTLHDDLGNSYRFKTSNGLSHAAGVTVSYQF